MAAIVLGLFGGTTALFLAGLHPFGERMYHFTVALPSEWERSPFHSIQRFVLVSFLFVPFAWLGAIVFTVRQTSWIDRLRHPTGFLIATTTITCLYTVAATGSSNNHYIPLFVLLEAAAVLGAWRIASEGPPRWLFATTILTALVGCLVAAAAAWKNEGHPLPLFVAPVLVVAAVLGWFIERRFNRPRAWAALLLGGQFAASFYLPWDYFPPNGWRSTLEEFRAEIRRLAPDVAWPDYGTVPLALAGTSVQRFPSWVVLEDVTRARVPRPADIRPFRDRMSARPPQWLITCTPLDSIPIWQEYTKEYALEVDHRVRFAGLLQLCRHWYGERSFPRFVYRRSANPQHSEN